MSRSHRTRLLVALVATLSLIAPSLPRAMGIAHASDGNANIHLTKTVGPASVTPSLSLSLAVDRKDAIPGDSLTYTSTVTNVGATLGVGGAFTARNDPQVPATIVAYYDIVEYHTRGHGAWLPLAGAAAAQPGYTFEDLPTTMSGMDLHLTSSPTSGVTYPTGGDPILGTVIGAGATASWTYTASIALTPSQVATLSDRQGVDDMRNVVHFEVSPRARSEGQPAKDFERFDNPFQSQSAAVTNVTVAITPPGSAPVTFNSSKTPSLASLAPGASATLSTLYTVPVITAKVVGTSDADYLAALKTVDGATLTAKATATGTGASGPVTAAQSTADTTEHVPVLTVSKSGPPRADAGSTASYSLLLANSGSAPASSLSVTDSLPGGATGNVSAVPSSLVPGAQGTATAAYAIPASQPPGNLTDTASLGWQDANGNSYGPISSLYTTVINSSFAGSTLRLTPPYAGPNVLGTSQTLTATLLDANNAPIPNQTITFSVAGPNVGAGIATTDRSGVATFSYRGAVGGTDSAQATFPANGLNIQSNTASIGWIQPTQPVSSTTVRGRFFLEGASTQSFVAHPGDTPVFEQNFPTIAFDPPAREIPHVPSTSMIGPGTRPFTDLTTDVAGNYMGSIVAQGNGTQAGVAPLDTFNAVFTANLTVAHAGDIQFKLDVNAGYLFGVGGGASRVNGDYQGSSAGATPPATTPFEGYTTVGAYDLPTSGARYVTVHFPAPGTYPYELDYFERAGDALMLTLTTVSYTADTSPLAVYAGYADSLRPDPSRFPSPWAGSPSVTFAGQTNVTYDSGALRFDNTSASPIALGNLTVSVGGYRYALWDSSLTIPANGILIVASTWGENFDSSDTPITCSPDGVIPQINVTVNGTPTTYSDTHQILNTGGIDPPTCGRGNESHAWDRIGGTSAGISLPVPPSATLTLAPANSISATSGQTQAFTVEAMDGSGQPLANTLVTLHVFGANGKDVTGTTDSSGLATLTYVGMNAGVDQVEANAFVTGMLTYSSVTTVTWTNPPSSGSGGSGGGSGGGATPPPPSITAPSPADGTVVTKPVPITATFTPAAGQTITSWKVMYQALDPEPPITIASGAGTPPSTLGTFDPTVLANDTYAITVYATDSGGGTQSLTTTVAVSGNLKLGRYVTSYQDLNVPVNGMQMQVRRAYDSYDKRVGDFGVGWRVQLANFRTSSNRMLGAGGWSMYDKWCFGICLTGYRTSVPHYVTVTFPDGHQEQFDFTPTGGTNLFLDAHSAFTARPGTTSTLQVDGGGDLTYGFDGNLYTGFGGSIFDPQRFDLTTQDGRVLVLDVHSGLVSETDPNGNSLTVDSSGVHASNGESVTFVRDGSNRITAITGPSGQNLHYTYSDSGDLATSTDADGNVVSYTYDGNHNLLTASGPGGKPFQTLTYDNAGRLQAVTDADGNTTTIADDVGAQQQTVIDPNGKLTTVYSYDGLGDLLQQDQVFNNGGRPTTLTTRWTYDALGHPTSRTDPLLHVVKAQYDLNGNLTDYTDAENNTTHLDYNGLGEVTAIAAPGNVPMLSMTYDQHGALIQVQRPDHSAYTYGYDGAGHITSIQDPVNRLEQFAYDQNGHLQNLIDPAGKASTVTTDASGRITQVTDANNATTKYGYDSRGDLTSIQDANGNTRSFTYDFLGRPTGGIDALGHTTAYHYDPAGRLDQYTNRDGQTVGYAYDADGRVTSQTLPGNDVTTFAYDPIGRLVDSSNANSDIQYSYDAASRILTQTSSGGPASNQPTVTLSYGYNGNGDVVSLTGPDGTTHYAYDALSRLQSITDPTNGVFGLGYDSLSRLQSLTRPNGVSDALTYNGADELTSRVASLSNGGAATIVGSAAYGYDLNGQRSSLTDFLGTHSYSYDAAGQLIAASHPVGGPAAETYSYDPAGNRTATASFPLGSINLNANSQLTTDPSNTYSYNNEGDLTSRTDATSGAVTTYDWNAQHQLLAVHLPDGTTTSYKYDPWGRRIEVSAGGHITRYVYDGSNIHLEYDGSNNLVASYTNGPEPDSVVEMVRNRQPYYYIQDGLGSTTALTDSSGSAVATYTYNSFGVQTSTGTVTNPFTFTGREYDASTGLYYFRGRYYAPWAGRFISEDPLVVPNRYPYGVNDPVNSIDPTGAGPMEEDAEILESEEAAILEAQQTDMTVAEELGNAEEQAFGRTLQPGPNAGQSIPARGPGTNFTPEERSAINDIGRDTGCHTCGSTDPGTKSGNFVPDHQPPSKLNVNNDPQQLYPHCISCSRVQGGEVNTAIRTGRGFGGSGSQGP